MQIESDTSWLSLTNISFCQDRGWYAVGGGRISSPSRSGMALLYSCIKGYFSNCHVILPFIYSASYSFKRTIGGVGGTVMFITAALMVLPFTIPMVNLISKASFSTFLHFQMFCSFGCFSDFLKVSAFLFFHHLLLLHSYPDSLSNIMHS